MSKSQKIGRSFDGELTDSTLQNEYMTSKRYQGLIVSIGIFLSLIIILLAFTIYASNTLRKDATLISEAGQMSTAAQEVIKDLMDLQASYGESVRDKHIETIHARLKRNTDFITQHMTLLEKGGKVATGEDGSYSVPALTEVAALTELLHANKQWSLLKPRIEAYLKNADNPTHDSHNELQQAVDQARTSSLLMSTALDGLTIDIFADSQAQAKVLRLTQIIGILAILVYLAFFVLYFIRRLRESDAETIAAQQETAEIMQTVSTGLFLLDKELNIGQQHSRALEGIIGVKNLAGENLTHILRNRISHKDLETTRQFVDQLYNPRVKEKLIHSLNPLNRVAFNSDDTGSRYLDFKFSRVYEGDKIARILVNVEDVSDAVRLEKRLEQERLQNDLQIDMLTTILNVSPDVIQNFIAVTKERIERVNDILKSPGSTQFGLEGKLKSIYREMHSLKGEASALKLHGFTKIATDAESKLTELQNKDRLAGNDFLPLTVHLDSLLELSGMISMLGERIAGGGRASAAKPAVPSTPLTSKAAKDLYHNFTREIAERQGKLCVLDDSAFQVNAIIPSQAQLVKDIIIQLLRNAVVHGIETPDVRERHGKDEIGLVKLELGYEDEQLRIVVEDDGRGIDENDIREKMLASGKYDAQKVAALSKRQLIGALFSSGFSTRDGADEDGGRGVGLDIVKDLVVKHGGKIDVQTRVGEFTRFIVTI